MKPERWKVVDELLDAALDAGPSERARLLEAAGAEDPELRREVESLITAHEAAGGFIEADAFEVAARGLAREGEAARAAAGAGGTAVGHGFGHYRVLALLGAGGMGEVYLARDARLGRQVALKILPAEFTGDADRVRRFEREARAASALTHPGIVTIYEFGREGGAYFIATEYVEGRTLRRVIEDARTTTEEALDIACQTASALSAAHGAGVVHRDVKPENVMLRPDGFVKVLDFGLAKLAGPAAHTAAHAGSDAALKTGTGAVMGTVAYMSPEQALGEEVDQRTDIFSLGVVLYELFSGRHPFRGPTQAATFDAILNRDPAPLAGPDRALPAELGRVVARALEKDRELRYQTVSDLRAELRRVQRDLASAQTASGDGATAPAPTPAPDAHASAAPQVSAAHAAPRTRASRLGLALAAVAVACAAAAGLYYLALRRPAPQAPTANAAAPSAARSYNFYKLTDLPGVEHFPSLSPDGSSVAYASRAAGNWDIYVRRVGSREHVNLTGDATEADTHPAFSPDGRHIAFRSERERGGIFLMPAAGGPARRLTDFGFHPAWSPDGREIVFATHNVHTPAGRRLDQSVLWVVNVQTGLRRQLTLDGRGDAAEPSWSPTGARVVYWGKRQSAQRDLWTIPAAGGEPVALLDDAHFDWHPVWSADGRHVYFSSDRGGSMNLWRLPVDEQTGRATGPPEAVTAPSPYAQHVAFSRDGRRAAYVSLSNSTNLMRVAFNPYKEEAVGEPAAITRGSRSSRSPNLSPDGQTVVYAANVDQREDIHVVDRDGAAPPRQLTDDVANDRGPVWSPDGRQLAFYSNRSGKYEIWTINADGTDLRQRTFTEGSSAAYPVWSPDGARLAYSRHAECSSIIETGKAWEEQTPWRIPTPPDRQIDVFWASSWSPDGRRLAGWAGSVTGQASSIVVYDFERNRFDRLTEFGESPIWLNDNRRLLFVSEGKFYIVNVETRKVREVFSAGPYNFAGKALSADNRTLFYGLSISEADVWLFDLE